MIRAILDQALEGRELDLAQTIALFAASGDDLVALAGAADELRRRQAGDGVAYVVNRNVNFTNVCVKACRFCAFSRTRRSEEGYFLDLDEIVRRAVEARDLGASEVCIQAGLAPGMDPRFYVDVLTAIKRAAPELHCHAFSPEEVKYGASLAKVPLRAWLEELAAAGLGSLPGTSAEILDDAVRARIAPGRITTAEWIDVVTTAHAIGIRTTSTMMYGHLESDADRARHLLLLRSIQKETGGFTEFVPLSFVAAEAPMARRGLVRRDGPSRDDVVRVHAIARLVLGESFRNVQVSWVKEGIERTIDLLACGANDVGGTLINESISTAAGAAHGQRLSPSALRAMIRRAGRVPIERDTLYRARRTFEHEEPTEDALDAVADGDARFGSYAELARSTRFRFAGSSTSR